MKPHLAAPLDRVAEHLADALPELSPEQVAQAGGRQGRAFSHVRRLALARLLLDVVRGRFLPHRDMTEAVSISARALRRRLHAKEASVYNALLRLVATFDTFSFHVGGRTTRALHFHPHMLKVAEQVYVTAATASILILPADVPETIPPTIWPAHGAHKASIPGVLQEVTLQMADRAIRGCDPQDIEALGSLVEARYAIALHGGLPQAFDGEMSNGRLNPVGVVSLVFMPRHARALLLRDTGWFDYDLASCHLRILRDLGKHHGLPTAHIERYLTDKDQAHAKWAEAVGHDAPEDFKEIILAIQNGASVTASEQTTLGALLGPEKAERWLHRGYVKALLAEIRQVTKQVVAQATEQSGTYRNVLGLTITKASHAQACSHVWTGYEVWVMRELLACVADLRPGTLRAYIYDGFILSAPLSVEQVTDLEEHVRRRSRKALGVELNIKLKAAPFAKVAVKCDRSDVRAPAVVGAKYDPETEAWLQSHRTSVTHIDKKEGNP